jgi:hypothetical protein
MYNWFAAWMRPPPPVPATPPPTITPVPAAPYFTGNYPGYAYCEQIVVPALYQLLWAAKRWDQIAEKEGLKYAFVGRFVARLVSKSDFLVQELEILLEPRVLENNGALLRRIFDEYIEYFGVDGPSPAHHLILVDQPRRKGIAIRATCLGTDGYPYTLEPMLFHPLGLPPGPEPTTHRINLTTVDPSFSGTIPVLRAHLILQQRLLHFDFNAADQSQSIRELPEIESLLRHVALAPGTSMPQFRLELRPDLSAKVRAWIYFADGLFVKTGPADVATWRRLGLDITDDYISRVFR